MAGRAFAHWMTQYRRIWRGSAISSVLEPLGFLAAIGLGLGTLVDNGPGSGGLPGGSYLDYLAPGLLAASAMQTASFESTYSVLGAIKWHRQYLAMLAGPFRVVDVLTGHLLFVALRIVINASIFFAVMVVFGAIESPWGLLALPVAVLTGVTFATLIFAFSALQETGEGFAMLYRFGIVPMFLFSGTFFPISQLPDWLEPVAWVTPVWHGVDLCRDLSLGQAQAPVAVLHIGYLLGWTALGFFLAHRSFTRRLVK